MAKVYHECAKVQPCDEFFTVYVAVEFLDSKCMDLVEHHLGYSKPIQPANFYTLVETAGSHDQHDKEVT